jgi:hypothetical protein
MARISFYDRLAGPTQDTDLFIIAREATVENFSLSVLDVRNKIFKDTAAGTPESLLGLSSAGEVIKLSTQIGISDGDKQDIIVSNTGGTWTVKNKAITFQKIQDINTARVLGRITPELGSPEELTGTQITSLLDLFSVDSQTKGLVPGSNNVGATYYLNGAGGWSVPPSIAPASGRGITVSNGNIVNLGGPVAQDAVLSLQDAEFYIERQGDIQSRFVFGYDRYHAQGLSLGLLSEIPTGEYFFIEGNPGGIFIEAGANSVTDYGRLYFEGHNFSLRATNNNVISYFDIIDGNLLSSIEGFVSLVGGSGEVNISSTGIILDGEALFLNTTHPMVNDDTLAQVLVRDTLTGEIKYRNASSLTGGTGGGVDDGSKVDITVAGSTWTINPNVVNFAKLQQSAAGFSVLGKYNTGAGNFAEIVAGTDSVLGRSGSGNLAFGTIVTNQIANQQVTYSKIQNVSATSRILGRVTAGPGSMEELTGTQVTALLDVFSTTTVTKGLVPGSNNAGATAFLNANGTWTIPQGVATAYTIGNGLSNNAGTINLGNTLVAPVVIFGDNNNTFDVWCTNTANTYGKGELHIGKDLVLLRQHTSVSAYSLLEASGASIQLYSWGGTNASSLAVHQNGAIIVGSTYPNFTGIIYSSDFSANFSDRSLIDLGYAKTRLLGKTLAQPTATEAGKSIRWNATNTAWEYYVPSDGSTSQFLDFGTPISATNYQFTTADNGKVFHCTHVDGCTLTLPTGLPVGWNATIFRDGGTVTVVSQGTFKAAGNRLTISKTGATLYHYGSDVHVALGAFGVDILSGQGITVEGSTNTVNWGGTISQNIAVDGALHNSQAIQFGSTTKLGMFKATAGSSGTDFNSISVTGGVTGIELISFSNSSIVNKIAVTTAGIKVTLGGSNKFEANADYSNGFIDESFITKRYADARLRGFALAAPTASENQKSLRWNSANSAWEYFSPSVAISLGFNTKSVPTATYLLTEADNGYVIHFTNVTGTVVTIPTGLSAGWNADLYRDSAAGPVTIASNGTLQSAGTILSTAKTVATVWHTSGNSHFAVGAFTSVVGGGGVDDGSKVDITVAGSTWTINPNVVNFAKLQQSAAGLSVIGKSTTGAGNFAEIAATANTVLGRQASGNLEFGTIVTGQVGNSQITYAKIQNVTVTNRFLGRITAGAGLMEELTGTQATSLLDIFSTITTTKGLVPGGNNLGATYFLNATGQWSVPAGGSALNGTGFVKVTGTTISYDNSTYLTANQTITLSGIVTGSGSTAITTAIADGAIALSKLVTIATSSFLGRVTASTGAVEVLTATQATSLLNTFSTSTTTKGLVPGSNNVGATYFLNATGAWSVPPSGGGGISNTAVVNEMMKSDGTNAIPSGIFSTTSGNIILGLSTDAGTDRSISVAGSGSNINLLLTPKGTGDVIFDSDDLQIGTSAGAYTEILARGGTNVSIGFTTKGTGDFLFNVGEVFVYNNILSVNGTSASPNSQVILSHNRLHSQKINADLALFSIEGPSGIAAFPTGGTISLTGGNAYTTTGDGNGGNVLIKSGLRRIAGVGIDGNIEIDSLAGYIKLTQVPVNDDSLTQVLVRDADGYIKYKSSLSFGGVAQKTITVESPTASENITMFFTTKAIVVTRVDDVIKGTTSVTWNIKYASTRDSGAPTSLFTADRVTSVTAGANTTTINNPTIPANSWVWLTTSALSGTPTELGVNLTFTQQ